MGRNGIEPPTYGFSDHRSTTELPKSRIVFYYLETDINGVYRLNETGKVKSVT